MADRPPEQMDSPPDRAVADPGLNVFGHDSLRPPGFRGRIGNRPYGEQLDDEERDKVAMHRFFPARLARMRAATRNALGR